MRYCKNKRRKRKESRFDESLEPPLVRVLLTLLLLPMNNTVDRRVMRR